ARSLHQGPPSEGLFLEASQGPKKGRGALPPSPMGTRLFLIRFQEILAEFEHFAAGEVLRLRGLHIVVEERPDPLRPAGVLLLGQRDDLVSQLQGKILSRLVDLIPYSPLLVYPLLVDFL